MNNGSTVSSTWIPMIATGVAGGFWGDALFQPFAIASDRHVDRINLANQRLLELNQLTSGDGKRYEAIAERLLSASGWRPAYRLGLGGSGRSGEAELFAVANWYQTTGSLIAAGSVDERQMADLLEDRPCRFHDLLTNIQSHRQLPLDGSRLEQLQQATTTARYLCQSHQRSATNGPWLPLAILHEKIEAFSDNISFRCFIANRNVVDSPAPSLRLNFRTHDGIFSGHWIIFPSDSCVPALDQIELRGRLDWPASGVPSGLKVVTSPSEFADARNDALLYPGPRGRTWAD